MENNLDWHYKSVSEEHINSLLMKLMRINL